MPQKHDIGHQKREKNKAENKRRNEERAAYWDHKRANWKDRA